MLCCWKNASFPTWIKSVLPAKNILMYGHDHSILETRTLVLQKSGYRVFQASELASACALLAEFPIQLCICCYTLSKEECEGIGAYAQAFRPDLRFLVLAAGTVLCNLPLERMFSVFEGPRQLVATVQSMVPVQATSYPE